MNIFQKVKMLFVVKGVVDQEVKEIKTMDIKSGWKTTEFWGKIAAQASVIWAAVGGFVPPKYAAIVVVVAEGIYTIARTALKIVEVVQPAKIDGVAVVAEPVTASATVTTGK